MTASRATLSPAQRACLQGKRVLVMGSGNGSNFQALVEHLRPYGVEFPGLFCDRHGAKILERAVNLGIPAVTPSPLPANADIHPKRHLNDAVMAFLAQPFDVLALAGYMRILPPRVIRPYEGKIINIHPSKLPAYPGLHAIERALEAGESEIGVTVHLVNEEVDAGPILAQGTVPVEPGDSLEVVEARVHALEHQLYPQAIIEFLTREVT